MELFRNRIDAGEKLAEALGSYSQKPNTLVIGLPRGGVIVAAIVANKLSLPLDIVCPRKIGDPSNPEYALGAITETGQGFIRDRHGYTDTEIDAIVTRETKEAQRRYATFRKNRPPRNLKGKEVIIVDDGMATGSTMIAAVHTVHEEEASRITVALPVAPPDSIAMLKHVHPIDNTVVLILPEIFHAVGQFYQEFGDTSDQEVIDVL